MFGCKRSPSPMRLLLVFRLGEVFKFILLLPPSLLAWISFPIICLMFSAIVVKTSKDRSWPRKLGGLNEITIPRTFHR